MKKVLLSLMLFGIAASGFSKAVYGSYTTFPNAKVFSYFSKPQLAFSQSNGQVMLSLNYNDASSFVAFDENSTLIIEFENQAVYLPLNKAEQVMQKQQVIGSADMHRGIIYQTNANFDADQSVIDKIVNDQQNIKSIRVTFANSDTKEWGIDEKYQAKLTSKLIKSYNKVQAKSARK